MFDAFIGAFTALIVVLAGLGVTVAKVVDLIRNLIPNLPSWLINVLALGIGVAIALGWQLNLFGALVASIPALAESDVLKGQGGVILTGLAIGAAGSFWHDKMAQWAAAHKGITDARTK